MAVVVKWLCALLAALVWLAPARAGNTQESDAYGVHVAVTPGRLDAQGPVWEFAVSLRSKTRLLRDDMVCIASLVVDGAAAAPIGWEEVAPADPHHRAGVLRFVAPPWTPRVMEIRLQRAGEPQARIFRWDLGGWFALDAQVDGMPVRDPAQALPRSRTDCPERPAAAS